MGGGDLLLGPIEDLLGARGEGDFHPDLVLPAADDRADLSAGGGNDRDTLPDEGLHEAHRKTRINSWNPRKVL